MSIRITRRCFKQYCLEGWDLKNLLTCKDGLVAHELDEGTTDIISFFF